MLKKPQTGNNSYSLVLILILALVLRLVGINHGFPIISHLDEPAVIRAALAIRFDFNPGHFDWPHLFIYLNFFAYKGFAFIRDLLTNAGLKETVSAYAPLLWNDELIFYLISRILAAVLGALTIIPVYLSGKKLFNQTTGLFAALTLAILPFHVWHSHYALIDVPMVFFLSWALYFCIKIFYSHEIKNYLLAGLFIGLAASTKYHGGLLAVCVPLASFFGYLYFKGERLINFRRILNLVLSGILAVTGFILGTPYSVLDFDTFIRTDGPAGALWQFTNVGKVSFSEQVNQLISIVSFKLPDDFGYTIYVVFFLVLAVLLLHLLSKSFSKEDLKVWFLMIPSLFLLIYISGFEKTPSHYFIPMYPFVSLISAYGLYKGSKYLGQLKGLVLVIIFAIPLLVSAGRVWQLMQRSSDITRKDYSQNREVTKIIKDIK